MPSGRRRPGLRPSRVPIRSTSYRSSIPPPASSETPVISRRPRLRQTTPQAAPPSPLYEITADRLCLTLPVPPSINHQYATVNGRRILSSAGRAYKVQVAQHVWLALSQSPHKQTLLHRLRTEPLVLSIRFFFTSPLRRDVDGGLKIAQDALCEGLGLNDNRIVEAHLYKDMDRSHPRMNIALEPQQTPPTAPPLSL